MGLRSKPWERCHDPEKPGWNVPLLLQAEAKVVILVEVVQSCLLLTFSTHSIPWGGRHPWGCRQGNGGCFRVLHLPESWYDRATPF